LAELGHLARVSQNEPLWNGRFWRKADDQPQTKLHY
jgi:hypothetical protein